MFLGYGCNIFILLASISKTLNLPNTCLLDGMGYTLVIAYPNYKWFIYYSYICLTSYNLVQRFLHLTESKTRGTLFRLSSNFDYIVCYYNASKEEAVVIRVIINTPFDLFGFSCLLKNNWFKMTLFVLYFYSYLINLERDYNIVKKE